MLVTERASNFTAPALMPDNISSRMSISTKINIGEKGSSPLLLPP